VNSLTVWNSAVVYQQISPEFENITKSEMTTTEGPLYRVIIHNDDFTPMDFVIHILLSIFHLAGVHALQVMYTAHHHGSAYVMTLPKTEAEKRIGLAQFSARMNGYPLEFSLEAETGE